MDTTAKNRGFYISELSDRLFEKMRGRSYKEDCVVPREDLRFLHILHRDIRGNTKEGEIVCHVLIARELSQIFQELFRKNYAIEKVRLIDAYDGVDEASMTDNNSSCFNYRTISGTSTLSMHGLGLAIDINPLYNPYSRFVNGSWQVEPAAAEPYLDREGSYPFKIGREDPCCKLFVSNGYEWGGDWKESKDYQHFEKKLPDMEALYRRYGLK